MPAKVAKSLEPQVQEEPPPPLPKANSAALEFLATIGKEEVELLYFSETLNMISENSQILGEYSLDIKQAYYQGLDGNITLSVLVHATSRGQLEEIPCGTSISGYVSWNLETYEQHHHEFIKFLPLPIDKKITLLRQEEDMLITRILKEGEENLGFQTIRVGSQQAEALVIEQTMHSDEDIPLSWQYYLLPDGHLVKRIQVGSPFCCIITKLPVMREEDEFEPKPVFEKKPLDWEEDAELFSIFRDRKEELQASHSTYMRHHPEAQTLISDFLLFLLLRQPSNVVTFAAEYFGPFARDKQPLPPFHSSNRPSPFRSLETSSPFVSYAKLEKMESFSEEKIGENSQEES
ncbi:ciliogenesis-associated TTC17-interacting protein isoform X2 [Macrotis lagotis]|uniref:ciliogenesis-associated TTC17-interacting protein isoform X2 n=1 Tax=Macrotis lagotis TaxID=92651 RepID=UPI003D69A30F